MAKKGIRKLTLSWDLVYKISRCDKNMGQRALMILNHKTCLERNRIIKSINCVAIFAKIHLMTVFHF